MTERMQIRFLRRYEAYNVGDVAVFDLTRAEVFLQDVPIGQGGPFAELVQVMDSTAKVTKPARTKNKKG